MCATRNPFPPLMSTLERVTAALFAVCSVRSANEEGESRPGIRWQDLHCPVATKATHVHQVKSHKTPERGLLTNLPFRVRMRVPNQNATRSSSSSCPLSWSAP